MILRTLSIFILCIFSSSTICNSQILSSFSWSSGSVTTATTGISAISSSSSATISSGGSNGNGLNPGLPKTNANITIASSTTFDIDGIDVQFDFQRDEVTANFFERGNSLVFVMTSGNLNVSYRVSDGAGSYSTISSGTIYSVPNDDVFRTYRFVYTPLTGKGEVFVNGTSMWVNNGTANRNMYWTGAGNIKIGSLMNGGGANKPCLDEFTITKVANTLPIELTSFKANSIKNNVSLNWITTSEKNNDFFTIEKSKNGNDWSELIKIQGAGNSNNQKEYTYIDANVPSNHYYYRLSQTDFDGTVSIKAICYAVVNYTADDIVIYPNPTTDNLQVLIENISNNEISIFDINNKTINLPIDNYSSYFKIFTQSLKTGIYFLRIENNGFIKFIPFKKT